LSSETKQNAFLILGAQQSGKSAIIDLLAHLAQRKTTQYSLNALSDTSDLIGAYEQVDNARKL
jgi:midasin (ATPase involved in ribosome maturation)